MKNSILILFISLFFSLLKVHSQSYSVTGKITSLPDSIPLQGANVLVKGTTVASTTNKDGTFVLNKLAAGNYILQFTFIGYSNIEKEILVDNDISLPVITMEMSPFNLDETVVTGTRSEKTLKSVPVLTQVITSRQISEMGIVSVEKVLESQVPGIDFARLNSLTNVTMQGMDAKYILFLVDGERMAGELAGNIDYSRINSGNIERIEVVKGSSSALYGSQAIGGVINIITKKNSLPFEMNFQSRYSKFNQLNVNTNVGIVKGRLTSKSFFVHNRSDAYNVAPNPDLKQKLYPTQEKYSNFSFGQKFSYNITEKLIAQVNGSFYQQERFDAARIQTNRYPKYYDYSLGAKSTYFFSNRSNIELSFNSDMYESYFVRTLLKKDSLYQNDRLNNFRVVGNFSITRRQNLISGAEILHEKIFSERVFGKNKEAYDYNVFCQNDISVSSKFSVNAGLRLNRHTGSDFYLTPSISGIYKLKKINFRMTYGSGYRTPSLKDLYINFNHGDFVLFGNPNLKPEFSNYFSGSVEHTSKYVNTNIELYTNSIRNMMGYKYISVSDDTMMYININKAKVSGVNLIAKFKAGDFFINGGYSFSHARDKETGKKLFGAVDHSANFGIEYRYIKPSYKLSILLQDRFTGLKYYGVEENIDDPEFQIWRISINQIFKSQYSITFGIENLFDVTDEESYSNTSPGRVFFVQLNLNLKKYKEKQ